MVSYTDHVGCEYINRALRAIQRTDKLSKMESDEEKLQYAWHHLKNAAPYCACGMLRLRFLDFYNDYQEIISKSTIKEEMMDLHKRYI